METGRIMRLERFHYETTNSSDFETTTRYYRLCVPVDFKLFDDTFRYGKQNEETKKRMDKLEKDINELIKNYE